jgi:AraC family ethanolamine operon transcriptional activator
MTNSVQAVRLDSFFPERMVKTVRDAALDHLQLGQGRFVADLVHGKLPSTCFDWGSYNLPLRARGSMPRESVTLGFVTSAESGGMLNGCRLDRPSVVILPEDSELDYWMAPGTRWAALQVPRSTLDATGTPVASGTIHVIPQDTPFGNTLGRRLDEAAGLLMEITVMSGDVPDPSRQFSSIQESLIGAFTSVIQSQAGRQPSPRDANLHRLAARAEDFLRANLTDQVRITDLCQAVGSSLRSIERAFLETRGTTPKQFLTILRLNAARRELLRHTRQERSVANVAIHYGFTHLGRFSMQYRRHFGESALASLQRPVTKAH